MSPQPWDLMFYPTRRQLLVYALAQAAKPLSMALVWALSLTRHNGPEILTSPFAIGALVIVQVLCLPWYVPHLLNALWRVVHPYPALIVSDSGLEDTFGAHYGRVGLLRWEEIDYIASSAGKGHTRSQREAGARLWIDLADREALRARRGPFRRLRARVDPFARLMQGSVWIPQRLLPAPVDEIVRRIYERYPRQIESNEIFISAGDDLLWPPPEDEEKGADMLASNTAASDTEST